MYPFNLPFLTSPFEPFTVINFVSVNFFDYFTFDFTNFGIYTIFVVGVYIFGFIICNNNQSLVPNTWSFYLEAYFIFIHKYFTNFMGLTKEIYLPFIYSLFYFIFFSNFYGNFPYSYSIAVSIIMSISISVILFIGVTILGFNTHKLKYFEYFIPAGTPKILIPLVFFIEILSYFSRAVSLGVRLSANIIAGHVLLNLISAFINNNNLQIMGAFYIIPIFFYFWVFTLELIVSIIQAYIFSVLTCFYIKDAIDLHLLYSIITNNHQ